MKKADGKIIAELKALLGMKVNLAEEIKLAQMKLDDGETMIQATPDFEVDAVIEIVTADDQMIPMPPNAEGKPYILEDGRELTVVEDGIIATIGEAMTEEETPAAEEEVAATEGTTEKPLTPKSIIDVVSRETKFSKEQVEELIALNEQLQAEIIELKKVAVVAAVEEVVELAKPIVHNPEASSEEKPSNVWAQYRPQTALDRVLAYRNNNNK